MIIAKVSFFLNQYQCSFSSFRVFGLMSSFLLKTRNLSDEGCLASFGRRSNTTGSCELSQIIYTVHNVEGTRQKKMILPDLLITRSEQGFGSFVNQ